MLKIRRPLGRLIFNMGIAIPGKTVFLIETAPWLQRIGQNQLQDGAWKIQVLGFGAVYIGGLPVPLFNASTEPYTVQSNGLLNQAGKA